MLKEFKLRSLTVAAPMMLTVFLPVHTSAHDVITTPITYSREISRLIYSRCVACHRPGGTAFSLMTYTEARPWAKAIKDEVLGRRMPPWGAIKGFGDFADDQGLTQEQLELVSDWVEGGAPEGDPTFLPKAPEGATLPHADPAPPGIAVDGELTLKSATTVAGVRVKGAADGASFMAVAHLPDGSTEPLLWLYDYKPKFDQPFWYSAPLRFPAGSRIEIEPRGVGGIALLARNPGERSRTSSHRPR